MAQKTHGGASHLPRARPGSGRVTTSVAVGAGGGAPPSADPEGFDPACIANGGFTTPLTAQA